MPTPQDPYKNLITTTREISLLDSAASVLGWDERTQLPPKGGEHRANQVSLIARLTHQQFTSQRIGEWLDALAGMNGESDAAVNVRELRRTYDRAKKLP